MTIIVTGGAGFIGSNFIFHMMEAHPDYRIVCLDCLTYAVNLSTLAPVMDKPNFRFVKESITDRDAVYKLFEEEHPDIDGMAEAIRRRDLAGVASRMGNVLESVTCPAYPVIDEIKAQMMKNGAVNAMMSGSGPTVFGIFDDPDKAEFARDQLKISGLSKQTFLTTVSKPGGTKYGKK